MMMFVLVFITKAQIPNNGFENWTTVGTYENPSGVWFTTNSYSSTAFHAVSKSSDHYPADVGSYSVKIANNTSLLPGPAGLGLLQTNTALAGGKPMFPITGHPTSLCGYYKFNQQNNDTMRIAIALYKNGSVVSSAVYDIKNSVSNWTSFNIPLSSYTTADSGFILMASYTAEPPPCVPHGNSELYIDNLSFDVLITGIKETVKDEIIYNCYPIPANDILNIEMNRLSNNTGIEIFNLQGQLMLKQRLQNKKESIDISMLPKAMYYVRIKNETSIKIIKLLKD
jgi:hypothetical protein